MNRYFTAGYFAPVYFTDQYFMLSEEGEEGPVLTPFRMLLGVGV